MIRPFKIAVPRVILDDLKLRIRNTRWPDEIKGSGWTFGADLSYMKELAEYWARSYEWEKTETDLNSYPNYIATINGYEIHFLHIKGKGRRNHPLIITHGWPYSVLEMLRIIPILTSESELSFDLVIPSMMGYGFSQKITEPGCNTFLMAELWYELMIELGYPRFGVQGGDFGAGVSAAMAFQHPEAVTGIHLNYIPGIYHPEIAEHEELSPAEKEYIKAEDDWYMREGGYSLQQRTRPLTLSYSLNDSPVGLCAWIVEKMYSWADSGGNIEKVFTRDELLSNVTLYWVTETIHSSVRLYNENSKIRLKLGSSNKIKVPAGIARFRYEEPFPPRQYVERGFTISRWSEIPVGGHFPAIEQPKLLADDITEFFETCLP